jgi:hypothetical protein
MQKAGSKLIAAVLFSFTLLPLSAQWVNYPTAGVPKTPDGKPNLTAPAPRTADRKPDFSGMWWIAGDSLPCPPDIRNENGECLEKGLGLAGQQGGGLSAQAANIAAGLTNGLPYQPWAADLVKRRAQDGGKDDPHSKCLPPQLPRAYTLPHIQKLVQTPGLLIMLDEFNASYRQVFTDGRPLPVDPQPAWNGYSTARWDGDTLVIDTAGFRDDLWLDMRGNPLTSAAKVSERLRRPNFGTLEIEFTVDDPKAYTKPWTVQIKQFIVLDTELIDEICLENEKSSQHMTAK